MPHSYSVGNNSRRPSNAARCCLGDFPRDANPCQKRWSGWATIRTLATNDKTDRLLDHLASDGRGAEGTRYADLTPWESLYNLLGERRFAGRLTETFKVRG
jgi:hypothetical protein